MDIITGEKIQNLCDFYVGEIQDFNFNPNIKKQKNKHLYLSTIINEQLSNKPIKIFIYTHILTDKFDQLINLLNQFKNIIALVFHNSDGCFTIEHYEVLKNISPVIYSQNITCDIQPNLKLLPIGVANSQWDHGNIVALNHVIELDIEKCNDIYFNFNVSTNISKRKLCYDTMQSKNIQNLPNMKYEQYLCTLKSYKYAICPEGNGPDTHRFWECLYLKVIPICLKNTITTYYSKFFPIVLLDDWDDIFNNIDTTVIKNWDNYYLLNMECIMT